MPITATKICSKCFVIKPLLSFSKQKSKKDGFHPTCKQCMAEYNRAWYHSHKEQCRAATNKWQKNNPDRHRLNVRNSQENREAKILALIADKRMLQELAENRLIEIERLQRELDQRSN